MALVDPAPDPKDPPLEPGVPGPAPEPVPELSPTDDHAFGQVSGGQAPNTEPVVIEHAPEDDPMKYDRVPVEDRVPDENNGPMINESFDEAAARMRTEPQTLFPPAEETTPEGEQPPEGGQAPPEGGQAPPEAGPTPEPGPTPPEAGSNQPGLPSDVAPGFPGSFQPVGGDPPSDIDALRALGPLKQTDRWSPGQYIRLGNGDSAFWDGYQWVNGRA